LFNLHGEPIVCSPDDALDTFHRSGLQHLALGNVWLGKPDATDAMDRADAGSAASRRAAGWWTETCYR
jgi:hypothetical protein